MRKEYTYTAEAIEDLRCQVARTARTIEAIWACIKEEDANEVMELADEARMYIKHIKRSAAELNQRLYELNAAATMESAKGEKND